MEQREKARQFFDYIIQLNVLDYQAGAHGRVCLCCAAADAYRSRSWRPR